MRLTPFGEAVRILRMRYGLSLKAMAEAMDISSAYLSSIEFGEKKLAQKHIDTAMNYLAEKVKPEELKAVGQAAEQSKVVVDTSGLSGSNRAWVAAFARSLQDGAQPTQEIMAWINSKNNNVN